MGEVYRAGRSRARSTGRAEVPPGGDRRPERLAHFHGELRIARQVSHKNVCRLYDIGESEGRCFLTMEYVDGEDLASQLRRIGRIPQDKAIEIARQLCASAAAGHECGVIHRDLKPANVMIDGHVEGDGQRHFSKSFLSSSCSAAIALRLATRTPTVSRSHDPASAVKERGVLACLAAMAVALLLVGIVSDTLVRHVIQLTPLIFALVVGSRRSSLSVAAALPLFIFWLFAMRGIGLFLLGIAQSSPDVTRRPKSS